MPLVGRLQRHPEHELVSRKQSQTADYLQDSCPGLFQWGWERECVRSEENRGVRSNATLALDRGLDGKE